VKKYIFIVVFQFHNTMGCPLKKDQLKPGFFHVDGQGKQSAALRVLTDVSKKYF
jgi:hypothetical protein